MQHLCPRCTYAVQTDNDGSLSFCVHCGMPQVQLSEELANRITAEREALAASSAALPEPVAEANPWRTAVPLAAACGAVALGLSLISLSFSILGLLSFLWAMSAPVVVLGLFASRSRQTPLSALFGARLGTLTGAFVILAMSTVSTVSLLLQRFVFHSAAHTDSQLDALFAQLQSTAVQNSNAADSAAMLVFAQSFSIPEFRAGLLLCSLLLSCLGYLGFSALGGAFSGFLRSRKVG